MKESIERDDIIKQKTNTKLTEVSQMVEKLICSIFS